MDKKIREVYSGKKNTTQLTFEGEDFDENNINTLVKTRLLSDWNSKVGDNKGNQLNAAEVKVHSVTTISKTPNLTVRVVWEIV